MEPTFPGAGAANGAAADAQAPAIREQDRLMPIANVIRIMRRVLPAHAKISDDAKETIQECVSEYISFITGEANERCQREQRKTITAEDVLWAMSRLGFDDYVDPLSAYLHRYRELEGEARGVGVSAARGDHHHHMPPLLKARAPAMVSHHDMHGHSAMYAGAVPPPPPHGYVMPPHHGQFGQYEIYGGEHGMAAYYGGMYGAAAGAGGADGSGSGSGGGGGASASHAPHSVVAPNYEHQHQFGYK